MNKIITIDVLSKATSAPAQGVGSVYLEQTKMMEDLGNSKFKLYYNKHFKKCDLYHIHSINPQYYFLMNKKRTTICYVHFLPDTLSGSIKLPKFIFKIFCQYVVSFYKKAKEIVVVNPAFIEPLVKLGIKKENITFIPNFVSSSNFFRINDLNKINDIKNKYLIPLNKFVVIGVGQVQTRKGVLDFLKVADNNPDIYFLWAGGFSFKNITDGYSTLKAQMEIKRKNVQFLGIIPREEMNDIYNCCNVFFMPSFNELFPMALLEACQLSLPYVVRDLALYKDILLGDYLTGNSIDDFSNLIKKLKNDSSFYDYASKLAKLINEKYSRENNYQLYQDYYFKIYQKYHSN